MTMFFHRSGRVTRRAPMLPVHREPHRRSRARRRLRVERLEDRRLLAVTVLEETFKSLDYSVDGTFSGSTELPAFGYQDQYSGTTADSGTMEFTSPTQGDGPLTITGSGSGHDNATCPAYSFSFSGGGTLADAAGVLSRFDVEFDQSVYDPPSCNGGGPSQFDRDLAGLFRTSDFQAELTWDVDVGQGGTSTGSWAGLIVFEGAPFDIQPTVAGFDADVLEFEFQVTGQPVHAPTHTTPVSNLLLFWSSGPDTTGIMGDALFAPVPVYWNQAGGRVRVTDLPAPPDGATHLLLVADYGQAVAEADEGNNVLAIRGSLTVDDVVWNENRNQVPPDRGFDVAYTVEGGAALIDPQVTFSWAAGPTPADQLGEAIQTLPLATAAGDYVLNVPARWGVPPAGTTHILVVATAAGDSQTDDNVVALRLHSADEILGNALWIDPDEYDGTSPWLAVPMLPGGGLYTMSEAEVSLGVDHFNWLQRLVAAPDDWSFATAVNRFIEQPVLEPYLDPLPGLGNQSEVLVRSAGMNGMLGDLVADEAIYFLDEPQEVANYTHDVFLELLDAPRFPDEGSDPADDWQYETNLVGVTASGQLVPLPIVAGLSSSFTWKTNALYDASPGDTATPVYLKALDDGTLPAVISGGVFEVNVLANGSPLAYPDSADTLEGNSVVLNVAANDYDVDGMVDPSSVAITRSPDHGLIMVDALSGAVTYTPAQGFVGIDRFEYVVRDDLGAASNSAQVLVRVRSNLGQARHEFTVRVDALSDPQQRLGAHEVQVGDVLSGSWVYDTGMPLDELLATGAELTFGVGEAVFPAADAMRAGNDLRFTFLQEFSEDTNLVAELMLTDGQPAVTRLPSCLDGLVGTDPQFVLRGTDLQGQTLFELTGSIQTVTCRIGPPWQNPENRFNVDADPGSRVTPHDALLIINRLARTGVQDLPNPPMPPDTPPPYYDVNGDGRVTPNDALQIINYLVAHLDGEGEAAIETYTVSSTESFAVLGWLDVPALDRELPSISPTEPATGVVPAMDPQIVDLLLEAGGDQPWRAADASRPDDVVKRNPHRELRSRPWWDETLLGSGEEGALS